MRQYITFILFSLIRHRKQLKYRFLCLSIKSKFLIFNELGKTSLLFFQFLTKSLIFFLPMLCPPLKMIHLILQSLLDILDAMLRSATESQEKYEQDFNTSPHLLQQLIFKICKSTSLQITNNMKSFEEGKKDDAYSNLINQEYALVIDGKSANRLIDLCYSFEMDPLSPSLGKSEDIQQAYFYGLLIDGRYTDLKFFLKRNQKVFPQTRKNQLAIQIANSGEIENYQVLWVHLQQFLNLLNDSNLKRRLREAALDSTLSTLSKYYTNYSIQNLTQIVKTTKQQLLNRGATLHQNYIILTQKQTQKDCLQSKLKQLAVIASRMNQFQ